MYQFVFKFFKSFSTSFIGSFCLICILGCSKGSFDETAVPTSVTRTEGRPALAISYDENRILDFSYTFRGGNTTDKLSYVESRLMRIDFTLPHSEDVERYYELEYDETGLLKQFYYKDVNERDYVYSRIELEYGNGSITKHIYRDQSTAFGPEDGNLEYLHSETLFYQNGNIVKIESTERNSTVLYTYGSGKSPMSNVANFKIMQILFTTSHFSNTHQFGLPQLYIGQNNLETKTVPSNAFPLTTFKTEFGRNGMPSRITVINDSGQVHDVLSISY